MRRYGQPAHITAGGRTLVIVLHNVCDPVESRRLIPSLVQLRDSVADARLGCAAVVRDLAAQWMERVNSISLPLVSRYLQSLAFSTTLVASIYHQAPWVGRFRARVRHLRTLYRDQVVLHYAPQVTEDWIPELLLQICRNERDCLAEKFGQPLPRLLRVFLLADARHVSRIFCEDHAGVAFPTANSILLGADDRLVGTVRHELSHLFAAHWCLYAPPLFNEGLAVLMATPHARPFIHLMAETALDQGEVHACDLLDSGQFYSTESMGWRYLAAGSFIDFLTDRVGWEQFRAMYRTSRATPLKILLESHVGLNLNDIMEEWRKHVRRQLQLRIPWKHAA